MNTKKLIIDLEKKCVELKHSDHKNKEAIIKQLEAAIAEIQKISKPKNLPPSFD